MADRWSTRTRFATGLAVATVVPFLVAPFVAPKGGRETAEVLGIFVVVAYAGHVAVTGWLWTAPDVRQLVHDRRGRLVAVPACLIAVGAVVPSMVSNRTLGWLLIGFFVWQFTHFQRQNLGPVAAMVGRWEVAPLSVLERRLIAGAGWCATAALVARPSLLGSSQQLLPALAARPVLWVAETGFTACVGLAMVTALRSTRPPPVTAAYLMAVAFMAPVFVFDAPGAAVTGIVVAHGLQYLWAVGCRSASSRRARRDRLGDWRTAGAIGMLAIVGGSALTAMSELHAAGGALPRLLYGTYFGIVMAHFAIDGVVWRRSPMPRRTTARRWPLVPSPTLGGL